MSAPGPGYQASYCCLHSASPGPAKKTGSVSRASETHRMHSIYYVPWEHNVCVGVSVYLTLGAWPEPLRDGGQGWVQAVQVVDQATCVTHQQLPTTMALCTEVLMDIILATNNSNNTVQAKELHNQQQPLLCRQYWLFSGFLIFYTALLNTIELLKINLWCWRLDFLPFISF